MNQRSLIGSVDGSIIRPNSRRPERDQSSVGLSVIDSQCFQQSTAHSVQSSLLAVLLGIASPSMTAVFHLHPKLFCGIVLQILQAIEAELAKEEKEKDQLCLELNILVQESASAQLVSK